ncbi:MAG TPA: hypothetical protein VMK05_05485 [Burkholderiales bacterium]|nr:hypothetical protein [Burkholderiales bacterium]
MIELGLAFSHAPAIFCPPRVWLDAYATIPPAMRNSQPPAAKLETMEVIESYAARVERAYALLRERIEAFRPDALIFVGDDQEDMFNRSNNPSICVFTGEEVWGSAASRYMREPPEQSRVRIPVHAPLARLLLKELIYAGFDPANSSVMVPVGRSPEYGVSHMLALPYPRLVPALDIPVIPIFLNEYFPPLPTAKRCWDLGVAIAQIFADRPERIAICASGGMSHDPGGPRAGWIDEPLDRWVLERIARNRGEQLQSLFTFDSDTLRSGTGELRAWITAAGACRWPATIIDYIPAHHAKTGLGFAYWGERQG